MDAGSELRGRWLRSDGELQDGGRVTSRGREREREDHEYQPVIVKRIDMSRRHADDIMETTIQAGREQLYRRPRSLALSAVAGGLMLTFSVMAVGVVEAVTASLEPALRRIATALVYPLGFIVCIMSSMELFTEHTATAVYPVLDRRAAVWRLLRLWVIVLTGNLLGALVGSTLLALSEPVIQARDGYLTVARTMVAYPAHAIFASSLLAGTLMALGAWLVYATPPALTLLVVVYLVTFLIGLAGLHHSIAGAAELFTGVLMGSGHSGHTLLRVLSLAVAGNLTGGGLFVALLNYGHVRQSQTVEDRRHEPS